MQKVTGRIKSIGDGRVSAGETTYSYIEIGDRRYKKVVVKDGLDGILKDNQREGFEGSIWITKYFGRHFILAVTRSDGVVFKTYQSVFVPILSGTVLTLILTYSSVNLFSVHEGAGLALGAASVLFMYYIFTNYTFALWRIPADDSI